MNHCKTYIISFFLFVFLTIPLTAQTAIDIIHLKNGSIVKGTITEQVMGQGIKLETKDGNLFVYKMEEIEKITKDPASVGQAPSEVINMKNGSIIKGTVTEQVIGENIKIQTRDGNILVYKMEDVENITKQSVAVETAVHETENVDLQPSTESSGKGIRIGVYAGMSSFSGTSEYVDSTVTPVETGEETSDSKTGFAIGGYVDFSISKSISIQVGLEYSQKGGENEETIFSSTTKTSFDYSYINIPLTLTGSIPITDSKFTPFALVGGSAGFLTAASTTTTYSGGVDEGEEQSKETDIKSSSESLNLAVLLGAGLEYQVSETIAITGQFRYSIGLSNMVKETQGDVTSIKSSGYYILFGARFSL